VLDFVDMVLRIEHGAMGVVSREYASLPLVPKVRAIIDLVVKHLKDELDSALVGVILCGSAAQPTWTQRSDIDLCVVIDEMWTQDRVRIIDDIPVEMHFVPRAMLTRSFPSHGTASLIRTFSTGHRVYAKDSKLAEAMDLAKELFKKRPSPVSGERNRLFWSMRHLLEKAERTFEEHKTAEASFLAFTALYQSLVGYCQLQDQFPGPPQEVLTDSRYSTRVRELALQVASPATDLAEKLTLLAELPRTVSEECGTPEREWIGQRVYFKVL
jgi:hypothetical protein